MTLHRSVAIAVLALPLALTACSGDAVPRPERAQGDRPPSDDPGEAATAHVCDPYTLIGRIRSHRVHAHERPARDADVVAAFPRVNAQGAEQVFPLVDETYRAAEVWYEALLPVRPNGSTGWIRGTDLDLARSDYRLEIDLSRFRLEVFERCEPARTYRIGIGTQDTPTPRGTFFLNSLLKPPERGTVYGAFAFGLSAYSGVIRDWEGGGIVGLHGTNDPSSIGRKVSHGCIRMTNDAIRELARTVPLGTIVEIV